MSIPPSQSHIKKSKKSLINFRATRDNFMATADSSNQMQQTLSSGNQMPHGAVASYATEGAVAQGKGGASAIVTTVNGQMNYNSNHNHVS